MFVGTFQNGLKVGHFNESLFQRKDNDMKSSNDEEEKKANICLMGNHQDDEPTSNFSYMILLELD